MIRQKLDDGEIDHAQYEKEIKEPVENFYKIREKMIAIRDEFIEMSADTSGQRWQMWPKIIQINGKEVLIISGTCGLSNFNWRFDSVLKTVYKYNLKTNELTRQADIPKARQDFNICHIGNFVYVVGGVSNEILNDFWQYDVEQDTWTELYEARLPRYALRLKLLAVERRYIFGLATIEYTAGQNLIKLDTWNIKKGWQVQKI